MLIVCCGMPRSASTLQYQLISGVVEAAGIGARIGWGWRSVERHMTFAARPVYVVKVHNPNPEREAELHSHGAHIAYAYTYRDLRDAAASWVQWRGESADPTDFRDDPSISEELPEFLLARGSQCSTPGWCRDWCEWNIATFNHFSAQRTTLLSAYESWTRAIAAEIRRVEAFLGVSISDHKRAELERALSLDGQRDVIRKSVADSGFVGDARSLTNRFQIKDARIGKWREVFAESEQSTLEHHAGSWLRAMGYSTTDAPGATSRDRVHA